MGFSTAAKRRPQRRGERDMNPTPKIPRGWRKLRKRSILHELDRWWRGDRWADVQRVGLKGFSSLIYIRRVKGRK